MLRQAIRDLQRSLGAHVVIPKARASQINDDEKLIVEAGCSLLAKAKSSVDAFAAEHASEKEGQVLELTTSLSQLHDLLKGDIQPDSDEAKELLRSSLIGLGEKLGGAEKGKLTKKGLEIYDLLKAHLGDKTLAQNVRADVLAVAGRFGGSDIKELIDHMFTLRDVIAGSDNDVERLRVLKDSVQELANRLVGENVLKIPQVRAAMLGFELGKAFGEQIASDLGVIVKSSIVSECEKALALEQEDQGVGTTGLWVKIDYTRDTQTIIRFKGAGHPGWICKMHSTSRVPGYDGVVVEAIPPVKNYVFFTTGGDSMYFDTAFSR